MEKAYVVELKPLFSAFRPRALGATTLRACLVNFLPLLESYIQPEEDDLEEDADRPASVPVDAIVPFKRSATHILREVITQSAAIVCDVQRAAFLAARPHYVARDCRALCTFRMRGYMPFTLDYIAIDICLTLSGVIDRIF